MTGLEVLIGERGRRCHPMSLKAHLDFNSTLSECMRELHSIRYSLDPIIGALELTGADRIADHLAGIQERLRQIDDRLTASHSGRISADLRESQEGVASIFSALLKGAENPRRVRDATLVGSLVVSHGPDDTPQDWPGRYGRDREGWEGDDESGPDAEIPTDPETGADNHG